MTRTSRTFRSNRFEFVSDADGATRSAHFEVSESATGLRRDAAEVRAQGDAADDGVSTDHGGHIVAHRFASNQGEINMFPQDAQFNNSAYKTLENELHSWVQNGFEVEGRTVLDRPPGSLRPDTVVVDYVVTNQQTGEIVHWRAVEFRNQAGETYGRVQTGEIRGQHSVAHDLHVRPPGDLPGTGDPARIYTVDGADHATAAAPEQLPGGGPTADSAVDAVLRDADLFARHGFDEPWTRQQLIDVINTDAADLTPAQRDVLVELRDRMPQPRAGEWIQKVVTPDQVDNYLGNVSAGRYGPNTIGGTMTRAVDTAALGTPVALHDGLRLDYPGTVFHRGDASVHVIRFQTNDTSGFVTPRRSVLGGDGRFDQWSGPFTGNGFTATDRGVIPEHHGTATMQDGAEMWEILESGTQRLTAVLQGGQWIPVG